MADDRATTEAGERPTAGDVSTHDDMASSTHVLEGARTLVGVLLLVGVIHHVSVQWSALAGREVWVARVGPHGSDGWAVAFVVALLAYIALSAVEECRALRPADGLGRLRLFVGVAALVFVGIHVLQVRLPGAGPHTSVRARYEQLWETLGQLPYLLAYVVGLSACCLYVALSIERRSARVRVLASGRGRVAARLFAGTLAFVAWGMLLHLLGHFAIGDGLIPTGQVVQQLAPRVGEPLPVGDVPSGDTVP